MGRDSLSNAWDDTMAKQHNATGEVLAHMASQTGMASSFGFSPFAGTGDVKAGNTTWKSTLRPAKGGEAPVFLYFTDVLEEDLDRAASMQTKGEIKRLLQQCMKVDEESGFRTEILADMHYHNYTFCLSRDFPPAKTSTLLSLMKVVLEESQSKRLTVDDAFDVFKDLMLKHSVERPPRSVGVFSYDDVRAIMDHMHNGFFRHYRLYMYAFRTHTKFCFRLDDDIAGAAPALPRPWALKPADKVEAKEQPELAELFLPTEAELAEEAARRLREQNQPPEDRATMIKRKVDEGVKKLAETFEEKLKEQDERYRDLLQG